MDLRSVVGMLHDTQIHTTKAENWVSHAAETALQPERSTLALVQALSAQTHAYLAVASALESVADAIRASGTNS
jgi:CTP synthase (UTP-ammonia lyase)